MSRDFNALREQYTNLLATATTEQQLQTFLEQNTEVIPREFLLHHGLHLDIVVRKPSILGKYEPDFMYLSKSSGEWRCVFVEIEKPSSRIFKDKSDTFHGDFEAGYEQLHRWSAFLDEASNASAFKERLSGLLLHMGDNPLTFYYCLVIGRNAEYVNDKTRKGRLRKRQSDRTRIMSFDALAEGIEKKPPLYVAALKSETLDVISSVFHDEGIFVWLDTRYLRIPEVLKADALSKRALWNALDASAPGMRAKVLDRKLDEFTILK